MSDFEGKSVVVVGLGVSGFAAARALISLGARVRVTEAASSQTLAERARSLASMGAEVEIGGHEMDRLEADVAVVSPGIPPGAGVVRALAESGAQVISEIELAYRLGKCDFLAVTGTNGKTTTTTLLADMLREAGIASMAAGNIGTPLADAVGSVPPHGAIAVEVSSFQLDGINSFHPRVAVILNVAEDHTDWHGDFSSYLAAKARVTENQNADDVLVVNAADDKTVSIGNRSRARVVAFSTAPTGTGAHLEDEMIVWRGRRVARCDDVALTGVAGMEDALAAATAALEYGVPPEAVERALRAFRPLPHRLQVVAEIDGVTYIDDSKATNPHATMAAVRGLSDVVLIARGRSKGMDLAPLASLVPLVKAAVAIGEARHDLVQLFDRLVPTDAVDSMQTAVEVARARSNGKGSVLLSPACASLDMYPSYVARGEDFARAVRALTADEGSAGGNP